jgi:chromosome segregation ATPase
LPLLHANNEELIDKISKLQAKLIKIRHEMAVLGENLNQAEQRANADVLNITSSSREKTEEIEVVQRKIDDLDKKVSEIVAETKSENNFEVNSKKNVNDITSTQASEENNEVDVSVKYTENPEVSKKMYEFEERLKKLERQIGKSEGTELNSDANQLSPEITTAEIKIEDAEIRDETTVKGEGIQTEKISNTEEVENELKIETDGENKDSKDIESVTDDDTKKSVEEAENVLDEIEKSKDK